MMIKRLLILGLVLALPAMASAVSVSLQSGGQGTLVLGVDVTVGQVIQVDLISDTATTGISSIDFVPAGETINAAGVWNAAYFAAAPISTEGLLSGGSILNARGLAATGKNGPAGSVLYSFNVTVDGVGTVSPVMGTGDFFFDSAGAFTFGSAVTQNALNIVPEPATIALLGLGGLLLRRRK
jgi:hypothetical protein